MRRFAMACLCLMLAGCGTFEIDVHVLQEATRTALREATLIPTEWLTPTWVPFTPSPPPKTTTPTTRPLLPVTPPAIRPGQDVDLTAVKMSDNDHGWAVERSGHILKTGDGGLTWRKVTPPLGIFDRRGLFALNSETAWAIPVQSNTLWRTRDGGRTWEAGYLAFPARGSTYEPLALLFPDPADGWLLILVRGPQPEARVALFKTGNGGESWEEVSSLDLAGRQAYLPDANTAMTFFDGRNGWIGGWWSKDDPGRWIVFHTTDGGTTWHAEALQQVASALDEQPLASFHCDARPVSGASASSMAVEMSCAQGSSTQYLDHYLYYLSLSSGTSWRAWALRGAFISADFIDPLRGWMMTAGGAGRLNEIYQTQDGGRTWSQIKRVLWQGQLDFIDERSGWAIVTSGGVTAIVRTSDGGKTWEEIKPVMANP
jgi:photosystem II stability/assembly factor-like uncharacterized protein